MKPYRMKLASLQPEVYYQSLQFGLHMDTETPYPDPIITAAFGLEVDYGALTAYLFRRFGYPNADWDRRRILTAYLVTTPHPDMLLLIEPKTSRAPHLSFEFLVPDDVLEAVMQGRRGPRSNNLKWWYGDDSLKAFAESASRALGELLRPVQLDTCAITAHGVVLEPSKALVEAPVSGNAYGTLLNRNPRDFQDFYELLTTVGEGDVRKGLFRATNAVFAANLVI